MEGRVKNIGSGQIFNSPILEKFTRTHISVPIALLIAYAAVLFYCSIANADFTWYVSALLFIVGLFTYTWVEYLTHRYLFHMATYTRLRKNFQYMMHGVHHEYPKDKDRLAMPPILSITISTLLLILLRLVIGDYVFGFLSGFLVGYSVYLCVHYMVHAYPPPKNLFKFLWVNHSIHHYKDGDYLFGVSSPLWDYVYGTRTPKKGHSH